MGRILPRALHLRTALEQAEAIRRGEVSSEELTRVYLARIERGNPALGAFVEVRPERAIAAARALDRARRTKGFEPPSALWGLPTGLKDLHLTRGFFARMGSRAFKYVWSPVDDVTSAAVRAAGMVIVGKLATSELAILPVVETDLHPPARNPWMTSRSSGGSSGGSSAAVAGGLLPLAPASDGAGSIRIPAAFCGLVGLKTTRGLVPNPHARFETLGLSVIGPHARSVDDAAALLDVLAGTRGSFLRAAREAPAKGLRVHTTLHSPVVEVEPAVARAVERVAGALAALGHAVQEHPSIEGSVDEFLPMFQFLVAATPVPVERVLQPATRWLRDAGKKVSHDRAMAARELFAARVAQRFGAADVWLTPTVYRPAPEVGRWRGMPGREVFYEAAPFGGFTAAFNASGHPAITLPVRVAGETLPLGVQLVGRHGDDGKLLALGRAVLEALGTPVAPVAELDAARA